VHREHDHIASNSSRLAQRHSAGNIQPARLLSLMHVKQHVPPFGSANIPSTSDQSRHIASMHGSMHGRIL
jgi:hypothetical protein